MNAAEKRQLARCPIQGCNYTYSLGIRGWHAHVANTEAHPFWHNPATPATPEELRKRFMAEYPRFFVENGSGTQSSSKPNFARVRTLQLAHRPPAGETAAEDDVLRALRLITAEVEALRHEVADLRTLWR